jgi:hypothetical protein
LNTYSKTATIDIEISIVATINSPVTANIVAAVNAHVNEVSGIISQVVGSHNVSAGLCSTVVILYYYLSIVVGIGINL